MNAKAAKRIRYAVRCMGLQNDETGAKAAHWKNGKEVPEKANFLTRTIRRLKAEYKATPFHRRDVHHESHSFVLQVKHGNATRRFPA